MVMEQMAYEHGEYLRRNAAAARRAAVARGLARAGSRAARRESRAAHVTATVVAHLRRHPAAAGCEA